MNDTGDISPAAIVSGRGHQRVRETARAQGQHGPVVYELHADFQTIPPMRLPTELLERCVFEKISIRGRALAAAVDLLGEIDGLARLLADDLREYGTRLRRHNVRRLRLGLPKIIGPADWSEVEKQGLIPSTEKYAKWLKGFQQRPVRIGRIANWMWDVVIRFWETTKSVAAWAWYRY
jgi:hypothetical protein